MNHKKNRKKMVVKKMVVKNSQILKKKWWPKNVLVTYLLVATELLFGLGLNRLKWPEMVPLSSCLA